MLRKIDPLYGQQPLTCQHPEHNPPTMIVLSPGLWEHTCPGCGRSMQFTVAGVTCSVTSAGAYIGHATTPARWIENENRAAV